MPVVKPCYVFYYYAMNKTTNEVKFVAFSKARTYAPKTHKERWRVRALRKKYLDNDSPWCIIETGFTLESNLNKVRPKITLNPKVNGSSLVYLSAFDTA